MNGTPEFTQALEAYRDAAPGVEQYRAFRVMWDLAPPEFLDEIRDRYKEYVPNPVGYANGEAIYNLAEVAAQQGESVESIEQFAQEIGLDLTQKYTFDDNVVMFHQTDPVQVFFSESKKHVVELVVDGETMTCISPEVATMMTLERISDALTQRPTDSQPPAWLPGKWLALKALARQRGISNLHIDRLERALKAPEFNKPQVIRAFTKWTKQFPPFEFVNATFNR